MTANHVWRPLAMFDSHSASHSESLVICRQKLCHGRSWHRGTGHQFFSPGWCRTARFFCRAPLLLRQSQQPCYWCAFHKDYSKSFQVTAELYTLYTISIHFSYLSTASSFLQIRFVKSTRNWLQNPAGSEAKQNDLVHHAWYSSLPQISQTLAVLMAQRHKAFKLTEDLVQLPRYEAPALTLFSLRELAELEVFCTSP